VESGFFIICKCGLKVTGSEVNFLDDRSKGVRRQGSKSEKGKVKSEKWEVGSGKWKVGNGEVLKFGRAKVLKCKSGKGKVESGK